MSAVRRARAALAFRLANIASLLVRAKSVHKQVTAHPALFPNPPIPLDTLKAQISALEAAQLLVSTRVPNTTGARDEARDTLCTTLEAYRVYVQITADASAEPKTVIENAGMKVAGFKPASKALLTARLESLGVVGLRANASLLHKGWGHRFFNWQYTIDGGQTWLSAPSTPFAQTSIAGLPSLTTCGFRVSVTNADGQSEWSQPVSLLVH